MSKIDDVLAALEEKVNFNIDSAKEAAYSKRTITNEKTWHRAMQGIASDYRERLSKLLNQLADLNDEIHAWPQEEQDE